MAITTTVVTVSTGGTLVVAPTTDAQRVWLENLEPFGEPGEYARHLFFMLNFFPFQNFDKS